MLKRILPLFMAALLGAPGQAQRPQPQVMGQAQRPAPRDLPGGPSAVPAGQRDQGGWGDPVAEGQGRRLGALLHGARLVAQDDRCTFLGSIESLSEPTSIFNGYCAWGSQDSRTSVWNEDGPFGDRLSPFSAFNATAAAPPMIIKRGKIIGYLTANKFLPGAVTPWELKAQADQF